MRKIVLVVAILLAYDTAAPAWAELVEVMVVGEVEFNQIATPPLGNVNPGDAAALIMQVDSTSFVNNMNFPTRGYDIVPGSFGLMLGGELIGLDDPFPAGQTPYFVLRDDDPAVDGFFLSTGLDLPAGVPLNQIGAFGSFRAAFSVTYTGGVLSSLDVLGALGTYNFDRLTVFNWTIDDGPFQPLGILFSEMTMRVPELFTDGFESGDTSAWSMSVP